LHHFDQLTSVSLLTRLLHSDAATPRSADAG
jgi:hypothetical protein